MADVKFSFQCPGRMYAPAWVAPEGEREAVRPLLPLCPLPLPCPSQPLCCTGFAAALQKKPEEINRRSADMWSFAVLLWELVTREVPFADLSNMEIGMKVRGGGAQTSLSTAGPGGSTRGAPQRTQRGSFQSSPRAQRRQGRVQLPDPALPCLATRWHWKGSVQPSHLASPHTSAS